MTENQKIFYKEVSKEELIKMWNDPACKVSEFLRIYDDETEGVIDDLEELNTYGYNSLAYALTEQKISSNKTDAYTKLYEKLESIKRCVESNTDVAEHYDCIYELQEVMDAINYIEALGF